MRMLLALSIILISCSTPLKERFSRIELGMDKTDVIDELGSPTRSFRRDSQDIWIYQVPSESDTVSKEISFKNGFVNYVGETRVRERSSSGAAQTPEEAAKVLESEIKKSPKTSPSFKDINEDGSF